MANSTDILESLWRLDVQSWKAYVAENVPGGSLGLLALCAITYLSVKYLRGTYLLSQTKKKIRARQAKAEAGKVRLQKRLEKCPNVDMGITELSFANLQAQLQRGDLKAVDVLLAYQAKALQVTREINCVTDFIETAEARAQALDQLSPSERGPLHGIPLSVKESVGVKGYDCTAGISYFINDIRQEDGILLQVWISQGAVPFARTNLSQGQMSVSCSNPLFGETSNPVDHSRTCGGSSGGEGALIGAGASPMGVGCDMAGSNRIPCHFCGICGMKPTPHRLSGHGNYTFGPGIVTLAEVYGPMGRDVTAVAELLKAATVPKLFDLDPLLPQITWREEMYRSTKPLTIGFYINDGTLEVSPAVERCVLQAKRLLENRGHTVVDFIPPDIMYVIEHLLFPALCGDDGEEASTLMKNDIVDPSLKDLFTTLSIPYKLRVLLSRVLYFLHPIEKGMMRAKIPKTTNKWWRLNEQYEEYKHHFLARWKSKGLDAVICPVFPFTAFPKGVEYSNMAGIAYTSVYNVVGLPTGVVPAGKVEQRDLDKLRDEYPRRNQAEKYVHAVCENSLGLPVGVQCVALPFQEEITLRVMRELEEELRK